MSKAWKCVDCGYETDDRWLMCPECTTPEDWAEVRAEVEAAIRASGDPGECKRDVFPDHPEWGVKCNQAAGHEPPCARFDTPLPRLGTWMPVCGPLPGADPSGFRP